MSDNYQCLPPAGTLYRSPNAGASWVPIAHSQVSCRSALMPTSRFDNATPVTSHLKATSSSSWCAFTALPCHLQMRMTSDLEFVPPVGFSSDAQTLYFAPCADPSWEEPCVAKRSTDAGRTWAPMDINSGGRRVWDQPELPPDNTR